MEPFPLFSVWAPFAFSFTIGMWTHCFYQMSQAGWEHYWSRWVSDSLWGERKVPGMCCHQKKHNTVIDCQSWKMPEKPSNPAVSLGKWRNWTQNWGQDFDFLRTQQNVGTGWWKEHTVYQTLCFPWVLACFFIYSTGIYGALRACIPARSWRGNTHTHSSAGFWYNLK